MLHHIYHLVIIYGVLILSHEKEVPHPDLDSDVLGVPPQALLKASEALRLAKILEKSGGALGRHDVAQVLVGLEVGWEFTLRVQSAQGADEDVAVDGAGKGKDTLGLDIWVDGGRDVEESGVLDVDEELCMSQDWLTREKG